MLHLFKLFMQCSSPPATQSTEEHSLVNPMVVIAVINYKRPDPFRGTTTRQSSVVNQFRDLQVVIKFMNVSKFQIAVNLKKDGINYLLSLFGHLEPGSGMTAPLFIIEMLQVGVSVLLLSTSYLLRMHFTEMYQTQSQALNYSILLKYTTSV